MFFKKRKITFEKVDELKKEALISGSLTKLDRFLDAVDILSSEAIENNDDELALKLGILATDCFYDFNVDKANRGKYLRRISDYYLQLARLNAKTDHHPKAKLFYLESIKLLAEMNDLTPDSILLHDISILYMELAEIYIDEDDKDNAIKNYRKAFDFASRSVRYSYIEKGYEAMAKSLYMLSKLGDNSKDNIDRASNIITKLCDEYPNNNAWRELKLQIYQISDTIEKYTNSGKR